MMERLEVKDQQRVFEELPGTLTLDIILARRQDKKKKEIRGQHSSKNWTMGIRIYRKAGYKANKNTNKKDQVSFSGEDTYIHTLEKKLAYLTQFNGTTF